MSEKRERLGHIPVPRKDQELRERLFEKQMIARDALGRTWVAADRSTFKVPEQTPTKFAYTYTVSDIVKAVKLRLVRGAK